ncbi:MAG: hypothetical protein JNG88_02315 [Phycisphaerales bacterium]|nr:hypothetical protein [Phycisphaerales bacterium]
MSARLTILTISALTSSCFAQFDVNWSTNDAGGGASFGGPWEITGTVGQHDATTTAGSPFAASGGFWPGVSHRALTGDLNCDGAVNNFDIDPFVFALTDAGAYQAMYPNCDVLAGDISGDGVVNNFDIDPFVLLLTGG